MYIQVYEPTSYLSLARLNEYGYFIFQVRALYKNALSLRKMFIKHTLIQFHFLNKDLEWSNCICVPSLHPLMKR